MHRPDRSLVLAATSVLTLSAFVACSDISTDRSPGADTSSTTGNTSGGTGSTTATTTGTTANTNGSTTATTTGTTANTNGSTTATTTGTTASTTGFTTGNTGSTTATTTGTTANTTGSTTATTTGTTANTTGSTTATTTGTTANTTGSTTATTTGTTAGTTGSTTATTTGTTGTTTGTTTTGTSGSTMRPAGCPAGAGVLSDFEEGSAVIEPTAPTNPASNGWWYVFSDTLTGTLMPAAVTNGPLAAQMLPTADQAMCNKFGINGVSAGHTSYVGFGATMIPDPVKTDTAAVAATKSKPVDFTGYDGISFRIKLGGGTSSPLWFEMENTETQPSPTFTDPSSGKANGGSGTATCNTVDVFNTRGQLLSTIPGAWTTVYVPFGTLVPRYLPSVPVAADKCPASTLAQAPTFNVKSVLGFQFSSYSDFATPSGTYNVWVDDVTMYKSTGQDLPAPPAGGGSKAFPQDATVGSCMKPTGAAGKYLTGAYNLWKSTFFKGGTIIRPENGNDTVSEGIAYGMLIAVAMNDKDLFNSMYSYWSSHAAAGTLMTWCIPSGGGSCSASGGSATDADEDAAYAELEASKQWSGIMCGGDTCANVAKKTIGDIWTHDIDPTSHLPTGGSNYSNSTSSKVTNASYFAPSFYKAFSAVDSNDWASVITAVYGVIGGGLSGSNGLFPAWCSSNCSAAASNGGANDMIYQYDSHRIPWRIGLDACVNGTAAAKTYTGKTTSFFSGQAATGIAALGDLYTLAGAKSGTANNSASLIGCAGVGAMSANNQKFLDTAYREVVDIISRGTMGKAASTTQSGYSYFNATVGMLTAITMSGNFPTY